MDTIFIPLKITEALNQAIDHLVINYGDSLRLLTKFILQNFLLPMESFFLDIPPIGILVIIALIAWFGTRKIWLTAFYTGFFYLIGTFGMWEKTMQSLALIITSLLIVVLIGIPMGVLLAKYRMVSRVVTPVLDLMQTFPIFVYMLPVVMLFSIGKVPAVIATVVYSLPPLIRLTELGLLQVDQEVLEASRSFGVSSWKRLIWVELPLARPSVMAGINQSTMMALAMVVVASMIGAPGLGQEILYGLVNLDFGRGTTAGLAIVILAITVDRITQSYGLTAREKSIRNNKKQQFIEENE